MKPKWTDLWSWKGAIDRGPYLLLGVLLFAVKYCLDWLIATRGFHHPWSPLAYLKPGQGMPLAALHSRSAAFYCTMLAAALPFVWTGVALTLRRLRAAGLPEWLAVLFFLPAINLLFFAVMSVLPSLSPEEQGKRENVIGNRPTRFMHRAIPNDPTASLAMSQCVVVPLGLGASWLGAQGLSQYGWSLFVALPVAMGLATVLIYGYHQPRTFKDSIAAACLSVAVLGAVLLLVASEGAICLMMAAPIALVFAILGGSLGYIINRRHWQKAGISTTLLSVMMAVPFLMGAERGRAPEAPLLRVQSAVIINAPLERVWHNVVSFSEMPPPQEWFFRAGIAYPIRAEIRGRGVGAVRHCIFSTGPFVEPITVWDEPRLLKFSVTSNPAPMEEWTPYGQAHPPHLHGYLLSQGGQFLLTPLPGGQTRLEGTTWYRHHMWPVEYWQIWSDAIIHQIHLRVLDHIKKVSEAQGV